MIENPFEVGAGARESVARVETPCEVREIDLCPGEDVLGQEFRRFRETDRLSSELPAVVSPEFGENGRPGFSMGRFATRTETIDETLPEIVDLTVLAEEDARDHVVDEIVESSLSLTHLSGPAPAELEVSPTE